MQDEIIIQGRRYKLVPVEESILADYEPLPRSQEIGETNRQEDKKIMDAVPKVSDYRERYKKRKVKASEIQVQPRIVEVEDKTEGMLEGYEYKGEGLFFGAGLEQDI